MRRRITIILGCALALALVLPAAAQAGPAQHVTFHGTWTEGGPGAFQDFPVEGCSSGTTEDFGKVAGGWQSGHVLQLVLVKEFHCNGSTNDTFALLLTVHIQFAPVYENHFTWTVVDASGALTGLRGAGTGIGVEDDPTAGSDTYTGWLKLP
jgi:hypothetical protein